MTFKVTQERAAHFATGHTYKHYEMTQANIFRGGGNQPSSMWAPAKTTQQVVANAIAAASTADVIQQARDAISGNGSKVNFDQAAYTDYIIGVERKGDSLVHITQFFPAGANGTMIQNHTMHAIARLFGRL